MRKVLVAIGVAAAVAVIAFLILRKGSPASGPATPSVPQDRPDVQGSSKPTPKSPAQLIVTVANAAGPITGARVRIAPDDGEVLVLETKSDGTATTTLERGTYTVSASANDHEPGAAPKVTLDSAEAEKVSIMLTAGGKALAGVVTDVSGGPIAGVRIDAATLGGMARSSLGSAVATTMTGADGKYALTVSEGQLLVAARSPDYAAQSRMVDVGASGATADFSLVPGGVIEGVVIDDRSKQPVAGASVIARRDNASIMLAESGRRDVTAGDDGRFRITGLRPGAYELFATAQARRTRSPTLVGLGVAEQITDVQLLVGKTPIVRGTVVDDANAPVPNAKVSALSDIGDDVKTDAKGAFVLDGLGTGDHVLIAVAETHTAVAPTPVEVGDKDVDGVVIRMRKAGRLKGHVDPRQAGCEVELVPDDHAGPRPMFMMAAPTTTGTDGAFELGPVTPGKLAISARCASGDQGKAESTWSPTSPEIVIVVSPGASIAGKVVDGEGKPFAGVTVMAAAAAGTMRTTIVNGAVTSGIQGVTSAAGTYELKGLVPGKYRMTALDRGRPLRQSKDAPVVTLAAAERKTGVDLSVDRPNGVIKGVVTGPDGKPLADAWVSVQEDLEAMIEGAMGGGRPGRPGPGGSPGGPGGAGAGPSGPGGSPGGPGVGPRPGGSPGGGPARPGGGGPGPDDEDESRMVMIQESNDGDGGGFPPALTDAQGRFEITGLPHLTFDVVAEAQAGKLRGRADRVTPDANLTIKALGVTSLSGTVRGPKGPAGLFTVELDGGPTRTQRSFTDGTFSLGRVDPGSYVVRVRSSDGNGEAAVVVAPNTPATVDISLVANAIVIGRLVDAAGKPMPDLPVVIVDDAGDGAARVSIEGMPPTSGPDGKFRIERKAGKAILIVLGTMTRKPGLVLEAGKTLDVGALVVEPRK